MTTNEQLKALAEAAKGWNTNYAMPEIDGEPIDVGQLLDGEFYPIITVDCGQYDQTSNHLAEYICYATPQRILALIAENERYRIALKSITLQDYYAGRGIASRALGETK